MSRTIIIQQLTLWLEINQNTVFESVNTEISLFIYCTVSPLDDNILVGRTCIAEYNCSVSWGYACAISFMIDYQKVREAPVYPSLHFAGHSNRESI